VAAQRSDVDIRDVIKGLNRLSRAAQRDSALFFRELKSDVKAEIRLHRKGQKRRDRDTVASHGPGRVLGRALSAYRMFSDESGVKAKSLIDWAGVLNDGGQVGNKAQLPKREFAFLGDTFVRRTAERFADFVGVRWA
jgi:hypothetical protein